MRNGYLGCADRQRVRSAIGHVDQRRTNRAQYNVSISSADFCWPMSCRCS